MPPQRAAYSNEELKYFYEVIESELGNQAFSAACDHPISSGYWETLRSQVCSLSREAYERSLHLTSPLTMPFSLLCFCCLRFRCHLASI